MCTAFANPKGANSQQKAKQRQIHYIGTNRLTKAASIGDEKTVSIRISKGDSVNHSDEGGMTPLAMAARQGNARIIKTLIKNGADVNAKDAGGMTPLHGAAFKGNPKAAKMLIANGANVNAKDEEGRTPLAIAKQNNHKDLEKLLTKATAKSKKAKQQQTKITTTALGKNH